MRSTNEYRDCILCPVAGPCGPTAKHPLKETVMSNKDSDQDQADLDNHANQLNPNNEEYWHSREQNDDHGEDDEE